MENVAIEIIKTLCRNNDSDNNNFKKDIEVINHIDTAIENNKEIDRKIELSDNFSVEIRGGTFGGSYSISISGDTFSDKRILLIKDDELSESIDVMNVSILNKIIRQTVFENLKWEDIKDVLYHEMTHRYDDIKHDIVKINKDLFSTTQIKLIKNDNEKFWTGYMKRYPEMSTEYNAYFLAAINYLKDDISKGQYTIPNNFVDFKADFEKLINRIYPFYKKSDKFRKHFNKRIYDLYTKLKN